jgi:hypothetical protein
VPRFTTIGLAALFAGALAAARAAAQVPETYGGSSLTVYTIPSTGFVPKGSNATWAFSTGGMDLYVTLGTMVAGPMLPNGSQIERVEVRACDSDPAGTVQFRLWACPTQDASCNLVGIAQTNFAGTPGCSDFASNLGTPFVVDNQNVPMFADVRTPSGTSLTTFSSAKIYYRLRVSPAPAVATFPVDVPTTHPFFRFVEALAAAGITGGCGAGSYCPDQAVTRGQMAVFLAVALGLHFPN